MIWGNSLQFMKIFNNILNFVLLFLLLVVQGLARAESDGLENLLKEAVATHPSVSAKKGESQAATYNLDGAEWGRFPTLSSQIQTTNGATGTGAYGVIRIEQPLWTGGRITGQIDLANAGVNVAGASLLEAEQNVLLQTSMAFFEVLRLESRLQAATDNEREHQRLADSMKRRVSNEISPVSDLLQVATRLRQAVTDRIQIQRQIATARLNLEQWVGRSVEALSDPLNISVGNETEQTLLDNAKAFSPIRKRLLAEIETAESQVAVARSQMMPTLVAGYQTRVDSLQPGEERGRAYLSFQVQPGAGLSSFSSVNASVARKAAAQDALLAYERQLTQEVNTIVAERNMLNEQMGPVKLSLRGSNAIVDSYLRQFQVGKKNWLEVLNAQREKTQAQFAMADIESPLKLSVVKLLLITGKINSRNLSLKDDQ
jgi:adhesin transport system outer membrane protein